MQSSSFFYVTCAFAAVIVHRGISYFDSTHVTVTVTVTMTVTVTVTVTVTMTVTLTCKKAHYSTSMWVY
jgi:hypothetical protein